MIGLRTRVVMLALQFFQNAKNIILRPTRIQQKLPGFGLVSWCKKDPAVVDKRLKSLQKKGCAQYTTQSIYPINRYCAIPKADLETQKGILRWTGKHAVFN